MCGGKDLNRSYSEQNLITFFGRLVFDAQGKVAPDLLLLLAKKGIFFGGGGGDEQLNNMKHFLGAYFLKLINSRVFYHI